MREVVDGVIEIPIGYVNAFAVVVDDGVVLVDTGLPQRADKIERAIEDAHRRIGEVHTILLTHWHPDHVGNVAELRRRTGARIVAHAIDAPVISGTKPRPRQGTLIRVVAAIMPAPEPVPVDERLTADGPISGKRPTQRTDPAVAADGQRGPRDRVSEHLTPGGSQV